MDGSHPGAAARDPEATLFVLDGCLTIAEAASARERLLEWLQAPGGNRRLDLLQVEAIDTAGVQLLLAGRRLLAERGVGLHIESASEPVRSALATYGLTDLFGAVDLADKARQP